MLNLSVTFVHSQTPFDDQSWLKNVILSDEFGASSVDLSKWEYHPPWGTCHSDIAAFKAENRSQYYGYLTLSAKKENCTCDQDLARTFSTGAIFSKNTVKYGYIEIYCKLPQLDNVTSTGEGLGGSFWLWPDAPDSYDGDVKWSEIDIFEIDGFQNKHTCNVHYENAIMHNSGEHWSMRDNTNYDFNIDFSTYHKFGCEWTPDYISFYFDDKLIRTTYTEYSDLLLPMNIRVTIPTPSDQHGHYIQANTLLPYPFVIDYVRVYKLTMDCNTDISQNNFNYSTFDKKVKRNITVGGASALIPQGNSVSFRATQSITLNDGFEVPVGSSFFANNCNCE